MNAIPTKYAGVQFRSRLEARWAAFFDLVGWRWEYEPIDLEGYIPDFVLPEFSTGGKPAIVEVKPIIQWPCAVIGCMSCNPDCDRTDYDLTVKKVLNSGWAEEAYLVGASWPSAGQLRARPWARCIAGNYMPGIGVVFTVCTRCDKTDSVNDIETCDAHGRSIRTCTCGGEWRPLDISHLWREAGNRVQWRGGKSFGLNSIDRTIKVAKVIRESIDSPSRDSDPDLSVWKFNPETDIA